MKIGIVPQASCIINAPLTDGTMIFSRDFFLAMQAAVA